MRTVGLRMKLVERVSSMEEVPENLAAVEGPASLVEVEAEPDYLVAVEGELEWQADPDFASLVVASLAVFPP